MSQTHSQRPELSSEAIIVRRLFEAAHRLPEVPSDHKCHRIHGHSYQCEVVCRGEQAVVEALVDAALAPLAHCYLNEHEGLENATSERLAVWIWRRLAGDVEALELEAVRIAENDDAVCTYRGPVTKGPQ